MTALVLFLLCAVVANVGEAQVEATAVGACQLYYGGTCDPAAVRPCCTGSIETTCQRHAGSPGCSNSSTTWRCTSSGGSAPIVLLSGTTSSQSVRQSGESTVPVGRATITITGNTIFFETFFCRTNGEVDFNCLGPDKELKPGGSLTGEIRCLDFDASLRQVWLSAHITNRTNDVRISPSANAAIQTWYLVEQGGVMYGSFRDNDGDSWADERSLFFDGPTTLKPNPSTMTGELLGSPLLASMAPPLDAYTLCKKRSTAYRAADYQVVNGATNQIQWQDASGNLIGAPVTGSATNVANPPAGVEYSLANEYRTLNGGMRLIVH